MIFLELFTAEKRFQSSAIVTLEEIVKKLGVIIFVVALVAGVILANLSAFGRLGWNIGSVSVNFGGVTGSGNVVTETRDIRDFSSLEVSGIFRIEVTAQKDFDVAVQADDNLMPFIKTEVRGGVLHIESEKHLKTSGPIVVRIAAPDLENIEASGVSSVSVKNLKSDKFGLDTSGASKITVQGSAANFTVDVSGASQIDAGELAAENATVGASGASNVTVNVSSKLNADASGASKIFYSGPVKSENVVKKTSGASSVTQKQ